MSDENKNKTAAAAEFDAAEELEEDKGVFLSDFLNSYSPERSASREEEADAAAETSSPTGGEAEKADDGIVVIPKSKAVLAKKLLSNIKENAEKLSKILSELTEKEEDISIGASQISDEGLNSGASAAGSGKIIEGVFDGENMIGPDGKQYSVPANYASKSKLVEGDILKLTITADGTFIYKQIRPIERARVVGKLERKSDGGFRVRSGDRRWNVLTASVTYFKGEPEDETVILVPKHGESKWAAIENIVKIKSL